MRQTIETAPRDGNLVILGYDASGTYNVAHWLPEAGQWIGENGDPSKITPSRWYPMPGENYLQQGDGLPSGLSDASTTARRARRHGFFPFFSIAATLVAAALIGVYFHGEVVAYVARYASQQEINLITIVSPVMAQQTPLPKDDEAAQLKQAVDSATAELRQSLQQEHDRAEALEAELVKAWRYVGKLLSMRDGEADQFSQAVDSARRNCGSLCSRSTTGPKRWQPNWRRCDGPWNRNLPLWKRGPVSPCPPGQTSPPRPQCNRTWPRRTANRQLNRVNQLALSTNRAGATAARTSGPTIRHPEPTWAMTDDGIPAHKFGRRFGDKV